MQRPSEPRRGGFTLIELLVVIAIIGVLVALTTAAVMKFLSKGPEVQTVSELSQMTAACGSFKAKFGIYPPSRIYLASTPAAYNQSNPLHRDSLQILYKMFSGLRNFNVDWSGNNNPSGFGPVTLEGQQCLVFFLGGPKGTEGFSTDAGNPCKPKGSGDENRIGPFFNFNSGRLVNAASGFPTYKDPWGGQVYAYFSSGKSANGYNRYGSSDCASLGVSPYAETATAPVRYLRPDSFQIVSAGSNGQFGAGGVWSPGSATGAGADDQSNFHDGKLGAGN